MLIGVHGKAKSGKDTFADLLVERCGFVKHAFADRLKDVTALAFDIPREDLDDQLKKEIVVERHGKSPREILQVLGTECFRDRFNKNFWVNVVDHAYEQNKGTDTPHMVVSDVRFDNEVVWARGKEDYLLIKIKRPQGTKVRAHSSEIDLPDALFDIVIENDGTLEEYITKITAIALFIEGQIGG